MPIAIGQRAKSPLRRYRVDSFDQGAAEDSFDQGARKIAGAARVDEKGLLIFCFAVLGLMASVLFGLITTLQATNLPPSLQERWTGGQISDPCSLLVLKLICILYV